MERFIFSSVVAACVAAVAYGREFMPIGGNGSTTVDSDGWYEVEDALVLVNKEFDLRSSRTYEGFQPRPINDEHCGTVPTKLRDHRIVGGEVTEIAEYPWTVALVTSWGLQFCGGSLINDRYVLTAAHCVKWGDGALRMTIKIGDHVLNTENEAKHVERKLVALKVHRNYNARRTDYDVALVKLDRPVHLGGHIRTVCLPANPRESFVGKRAIVTGWGKVEHNGKSSTVLRDVSVTVISNRKCKSRYGNKITSRMLCAGEKRGGKDACQGDSGGPLTTKLRNKWIQIGVVSWGRECASALYPGVYARVTTFFKWIENHSQE